MSRNSHDKTIKNIGVIFLSVIIFALIYNVLLGGNGFNAHMGYGQNAGYGLTGLFSLILLLTIKILFLFAVVAVVVSIVAAIRNQSPDTFDLSFVDKLFDTGHHKKHFCPHCAKEIETGWKHCPFCGSSTKKISKKKKHEGHETVIKEKDVQHTETGLPETIAQKDGSGTITDTLETNKDVNRKKITNKSKGNGQHRKDEEIKGGR